MEALRAQLSEALAEIENIKAIATVSESTKQEAIDRVKQHCQEEVASLQAIVKDSISNYEAQLKNMEKERSQWRQYQDSREREIAQLRRHFSGNIPQDSLENDMRKAQEDAERLRSIVMPMEQEIAALKQKLAKAEGQLCAESLHGPFAQHCEEDLLWREEPSAPRRRPPRDWATEEAEAGAEEQAGADTFAANCVSWSTGAAPAPYPSRQLPPGSEDTVSLLSTGTLVPESIYLPPPGHHLLHDEEWNEIQQEMKEYQVSLHQTRERIERETALRKNLEEALRQSTEDCSREVSLLMEKLDSSAKEIQKIKEMFTEAQEQTQKQMAELSETHKDLYFRNQQLQTENQTLKGQPGIHAQAGDSRPTPSPQVTMASPAPGRRHEEDIGCQLMPKPEGESSQGESSELLTRFVDKMVEVETLQALCNQQRQQLQAASKEEADLTLKLREERGKGQRLQVELDTSEQVQRDFVKLSQALQVRLEQIRQADSMEMIQGILDSTTKLKDASQLRGAWDQGS
ncbi:rab GTPase-binding effector protein 2-like isoform X2 [Heterodontus francisci]